MNVEEIKEKISKWRFLELKMFKGEHEISTK